MPGPTPSPASAIHARGVRKAYGDHVVLDGIDLAVPAGSVFSLLGPNGAGKTTTTEVLEGYLTPTSGTTSVLGYDPTKGDADLKQRIGIVLQSTGLDQFLTVRETIEMYSGYYPRQRATQEVIEVVGLSEKTDTACGSSAVASSGGSTLRSRSRGTQSCCS